MITAHPFLLPAHLYQRILATINTTSTHPEEHYRKSSQLHHGNAYEEANNKATG